METVLMRPLALLLPVAVVIAVFLARSIELSALPGMAVPSPSPANPGFVELDTAHLAHILGLPRAQTSPDPDASMEPMHARAWRLLGTLVALDPQASLALVGTAAGQAPAAPALVHVGEALGDATVVAIEHDRVVVLRDGHFEDIDTRMDTAPTPAPSPATASAFHALGNGAFELSRAELGHLIDDVPSISRQARFELAADGSNTRGFRLAWSQPGSIFAQMGLERGDVITRINGFDLASPERALELYAKLRDSSRVDVEVSRGGQLSHRTFAVR